MSSKPYFPKILRMTDFEKEFYAINQCKQFKIVRYVVVFIYTL